MANAQSTGAGPAPMELALHEARTAAELGEVPVGAVLVDSASGALLARAHNRVETLHDPTAHAEMLVISAAARRLGVKSLTAADLYVTLEPCPMCAAAISLARLRRVTFGAYDAKSGGIEHGPRIFEQSSCHHRPEVVGGVEETRCGALLRDFFAARR
jgi:tRNA(Arg) A34 adenosine deaminase TadA